MDPLLDSVCCFSYHYNQLFDNINFYLTLTLDLTMSERNFLVAAELDRLIAVIRSGRNAARDRGRWKAQTSD
jgi:hypothetical protein